MAYKRVLLKISGEQLAGREGGIDPEFVAWLATEIKKATESGVQMAIVVGGGNFLRGANFAGQGIERPTADYMGMLATVMNGLALMDMLEHHGQPTRVQTNIHINQVAEPFIRRRALRHLEKNRVVIVAGGLGKPYLTTDTAAASVALELDCDVILKATKVDGIYSADPVKNKDAKKYTELKFMDALNQNLKVMDATAISMCMVNNLPSLVFTAFQKGNIKKAVLGQKVGTIVH